MFARDRRLLAAHGAISIFSFRYPSGVAALEVHTGSACFVLLPFQGQQIWDAWTGERRLTMKSVFQEPLATREFRRTYGAFFVHCGATAMGSPQSGETHMPHGELPNITFDSARLMFGDGDQGRYIELTGLAHDREAFSHAYAFRPRLRFREGQADVHLTVEVENIGGAAMPFMYLGHVNFRPVDGGRLLDGLATETAIQWYKPELPADAPPEVHRWHDEVSASPGRHRQIHAHDRVEPEFVTTVRLPADADGWAHALQVLPDGSADFVSYRPADLPFGVRWITRAPERQALGIILPATAGPEGRAAAKAAGHLLYLQPGQTFSTEIRFGALSQAETSLLVEQF
ncbi:DUF4432 family protein [Devosia rhodophyticola]|uniref:DUF4432 family protein n=1 Tax=Devosia rhodophyticola TaxID=3026423 RepID=A0ABY7YTS7_9HYPH|nr:DUF4432 family protein [Devosia rhodophyticola]WDR04748.1 DUF4432 family protein [Devosia rhodophyticola]